MSLIPFNESVVSKKLDPLAQNVTADFPWADVFADIDGDMNEEEIRAIARKQAARAVRELFSFVLNINIKGKGVDRRVGRRFLALAWMINPDLFDGVSLTRLCRQIRVDLKNMATITGDASRHFRFANRAQSHAWNRKGPAAHSVCDLAALDEAVDAKTSATKQSAPERTLTTPATPLAGGVR